METAASRPYSPNQWYPATIVRSSVPGGVTTNWRDASLIQASSAKGASSFDAYPSVPGAGGGPPGRAAGGSTEAVSVSPSPTSRMARKTPGLKWSSLLGYPLSSSSS